jgi:A/G-specific adenine glycosylase
MIFIQSSFHFLNCGHIVNRKEQVFVARVWRYYCEHKRSLPWRKTKRPYHILVSEIMLQQTQVDRVIPKYNSFLNIFPDIEALADASLGEVIKEWQGLGYNRRAKMLHKCAREVVETHDGVFPKEHTALVALPGIGAYTASAVLAFAYNVATPMIETNIRTVYLHHFFKNDQQVSDNDILQIVERTMDIDRAREWYWALMDYGVYIKKEFGNPNVRSKQYAKQSKFEGSDRQIRGMILKALVNKSYTAQGLVRILDKDSSRVRLQLHALQNEALIVREGGKWQLPKT